MNQQSNQKISAETTSFHTLASKPYFYPITLILAIFALFFIDTTIVENIYQQCALSLLCYAAFAWYLSFCDITQEERFQVCVCLFLSIGFEVTGTLVLGLYTYRFENIPLYVPMGHAAIYLFALTFYLTPLFCRFERQFKQATLILATVWAISGVTWMPFFNYPLDICGLCNLPIVIWLICRSPRSSFYVGIFIIVSIVEFVGTSFGNWQWGKAMLGVFPNANPPGNVSVGYVVIDYATLLVATKLRPYCTFNLKSKVILKS
jgi:hypothetical protein